MTSYSLEKVVRIYNDAEGTFIEISQHPDFPEHGVLIQTVDEESKKFFGDIRLDLGSKDLVLLLAEALTEMAEQLKD